MLFHRNGPTDAHLEGSPVVHMLAEHKHFHEGCARPRSQRMMDEEPEVDIVSAQINTAGSDVYLKK